MLQLAKFRLIISIENVTSKQHYTIYSPH